MTSSVTAVGFDLGFTLVEHLVTPDSCLQAQLRPYVGGCESLLAATRPAAAFLGQSMKGYTAVTPASWRRGLVDFYTTWLDRAWPGAFGKPEAIRIAGLAIAAYEAPENWMKRPAADECIDSLRARGLRLGILSNWGPNLDELVRMAGWEHSFDVTLGCAACGVGKPNPEAFALLCEGLDCAPAQTVFVGDDRLLDAEAAARAGLRPLLIGDGFDLADVSARIDAGGGKP